MNRYRPEISMESAARDLRAAARRSVFDGTRNTLRYLDHCRGFHESTGSLLVFTRDVGHHSSGWWKNPDYERCLHLSLSFYEPLPRIFVPSWGEPRGPVLRPRDKPLTLAWLGEFFGNNRRKLWCEPPYSPEGKAKEVWHYRLFCTPNWTPILPRGEVYGRDLTEAGWRSWSDVQADLLAQVEKAKERLLS